MSAGAGTRYVVIYDGHCGVCTSLTVRLRRMDTRGAFEIVASQAAGVRDRFPWILPEAYDASLQLVRKSDDKTWEGARAIEQIVGELRAGWLFAWMFDIPFARSLADRFYQWFARNRGQLGCGSHCSS